ncbi:hypothetical protein Q7C36_003189 [Tachysurus vachellii]|uniref:Uncharacterized protein n=1 Tax=Tachysurus vachellii TaxID=175792 RepID=A0AA88NW14_TACVA|nr:hypothetical protein Q7C36_003189 [Tachysurus vachellii]
MIQERRIDLKFTSLQMLSAMLVTLSETFSAELLLFSQSRMCYLDKGRNSYFRLFIGNKNGYYSTQGLFCLKLSSSMEGAACIQGGKRYNEEEMEEEEEVEEDERGKEDLQ